MPAHNRTHRTSVGYVAWLFGFTGAHRFYFGKQFTGALWFCTLGLLGIGWLIDIVLIPGMAIDANRRYRPSSVSYSVSWLLLALLGIFGVHRIYMGKWPTGLIYLLTGGLFFIGFVYDIFTLNEQLDELSHATRTSLQFSPAC